MCQVFDFNGEVEVKVVYQSKYYTVARATERLENNREISAEGIARRSRMDSDNPVLGKEIAEGRALKALYNKVNGLRVNARIQKAADLLSNF